MPHDQMMYRCRISITSLLLAGIALQAAGADVVGPAVSTTFGPDGKLWRIVPTKSFVEVDFSTDFGKSFSEPVRVNSRKRKIRANSEDRPGIAVAADGRVFVLYFADAKQLWTTYISYSDDGKDFAVPVKTSSYADRAKHYQDQLYIDAADNLRVFWIDERDIDTRTGAGGALYSGGLRAGSWGDLPNQKLFEPMCECCRLALDTDRNGKTILLGRMVFEDRVRDLGLLRLGVEPASAAGKPIRVTNDEWEINACPEHGPALSIGTGDRYHVAWFTLGSQRRGLFYAYSDDNGPITSVPLQLGNKNALPGHADVLANSDRVALVWREFNGEQTSIAGMISTDRGQSWPAPRTLASTESAADYPFLLTDGGKFYVSWFAEDSGYQLIGMDNEDS
jgi:hypothetical protein